MTGKKMMEILLYLCEQGVNPRSIHVGVSTGSEITISIMDQLLSIPHRYMLRKGFVFVDKDYIYRP